MTANDTSLRKLTLEDIGKIRQLATRQDYKPETPIFGEGDNADCIYFIESGSVSIFIQKFTI